METPQAVRDVAACVGLETAVKLMNHTGKNRFLYIPSELKPGHPLSRTLSPDQHRVLARTFGNGPLAYPRARGFVLAKRADERKKAICQAANAGMSTKDVAALNGCSMTYARRIRSTSKHSKRERFLTRETQA